MHVPVAPEVAFDYLVDPRNRPAWQSSLARVEDVDGEPRAGQTWVDVTSPGLRPRMETTELDRPHRWTERGTWRSFAAVLTLELAPAPGGCEIEATLSLHATGPARPLAAVLSRLAPYAVRADLRRAARLLAARPHP
ncbi:SRPBCC family protein [Nocardioides sp. zg-DK7169]|uniref:SRPBCC family protein n=1 Tax=Nocardioides sp. zg-DK7169 TaxID=2736600 RepID=UPI001552B39F|nr:SRPBCC family protein [Nocardioides sp. zg-DK7169]